MDDTKQRLGSWVALGVWVVLGVSVALAAGCPSAEYELAVELRTDFVPGADFVGTRAELFRQAPDEAGEATREVDRPAFGAFADGQEIGSWTVAPGEYFVRARLLARDGAIVGEAVAPADVTERTRVVLRVTRSCGGVSCAAGMTCMAGSCVGIDCAPGECASECTHDGECAGAAACALGRCEAGACWFDAVRDACASGEYCDPAVGCVARPDAGGGTVDAGIDGGPPGCTPDCTGRTCGMDPVCGTASCGTCSATQLCNGGLCEEMAPDCSGLSCGPARNGVGGPDACGTCGAGFTCSGGACACGGNGAACVSGSCCSPLACGSDGACCTPVQMACGSVSECCPGRACQMGVCCVIVGDGCSMDAQCCNGHDCNGGRCCVRPGMGCSSDGQCCSNDCTAGGCA